MSDITDKKLIELNQKRQTEEATELRTAQERFIDMTSHELRNPLSAIVLSADSSVERLQDIVREGAAKDDAIAPGDPATGLAPRLRHEVQDTLEDLKIISHCCVHMTRLIDDVLTLSKLDNQFLIITPVPSRPTQFIRETLLIFKAEMQSKEIESELQTTSAFAELQVDYVLTDPSRMNQLLINLLTNAIKFTAPSKVRKIVVTLDVSETKPALATPATPSPDARDPGSESEAVNNEPVSDPTTVWLIVSVKDSGRGLTLEEVSGLFQRFKQANPRTHISYGGSGTCSLAGNNAVRFLLTVTLAPARPRTLHLSPDSRTAGWINQRLIRTRPRLDLHFLHSREAVQRAFLLFRRSITVAGLLTAAGRGGAGCSTAWHGSPGDCD